MLPGTGSNGRAASQGQGAPWRLRQLSAKRALHIGMVPLALPVHTRAAALADMRDLNLVSHQALGCAQIVVRLVLLAGGKRGGPPPPDEETDCSCSTLRVRIGGPPGMT